MAGTEAIINKILADAKSRSEQITEQAVADGNEVMDKAKDECKRYRDANLSKKQFIIDEAVRRKKTVAELDVKKLMLRAKKEAIDKAFQQAKKQLVDLSPIKYSKLVMGMIDRYAEDGDTVTAAKADAKIITKEKIDKLAAAKKIKLTLNEQYGDFVGGVILSGKGMDKNLTFDVELKVLREELETAIADMIFKKES